MDITKIIGIGIIGTLCAVTVRTYRAEIGLCIAVATGIAIFLSVAPSLSEAISGVSKLCGDSELTRDYLGVIIRVTGIAYITQFASELARDAGEGAISKKIEFAGKVCVLVMIVPVLEGLLRTINDVLMSF